MDVITYSQFRSNLARTLDKVNDDQKPVMITRQNGEPAILMSLDEFQSYQETQYLMSSPENARRLNQAIAQAESGQTIERGLIEE